MKASLLILSFLLFASVAKSQNNILSSANIKRIQPFNFIEYGNNYYFLSMKEKGPVNDCYSIYQATEYILIKMNKFTNQVVATQHIYGDTVQADSTVYYFGQFMTVNNGRLSFAYVKTYITCPSYTVFDTKYMQADTNLNITVPEKSLGDCGQLQSFIPYQNGTLLAFNIYSVGGVTPRYLQLDSVGGVVKADTFGVGAVTSSVMAEVMPYGKNGYLVSGTNILGANTGRGLYIADSNLAIQDTFMSRPFIYTWQGNYTYMSRLPNLAVLPSGNVIAAGLTVNTSIPANNQYAFIAKTSKALRFANTATNIYPPVDSNDMFHSLIPSIHNLEYNETDNRIYFADATNKESSGACGSYGYGYLEVICADTSLNTKWTKYIYLGPDSCGTVTIVSKPYNRPGILIVAGGTRASDANNPLYTREYVFYLDSSSVASVPKQSGIQIRDRIAVYPNPAKDVITIDDVFSKLYKAEIYNTEEKCLFSKELEAAKESRINISTLLPGMYIIKTITKDGEVNSFKILKEE